MLSVMGAVHEFDRALIKERQREGIALAKKRGAFKGRKKSLSHAEVTELRQQIAAGMSKARVARELGISRQTLYQYLRGARVLYRQGAGRRTWHKVIRNMRSPRDGMRTHPSMMQF